MTDLTLLEILSLDFKQAYDLLLIQSKDPDNNISKNDLDRIRFGFDLEFDVYLYLGDAYILKPKRGLVKIGSNVYYWKDFFTEMEKRQTMTKDLLLSCSQKDEFQP